MIMHGKNVNTTLSILELTEYLKTVYRAFPLLGILFADHRFT